MIFSVVCTVYGVWVLGGPTFPYSMLSRFHPLLVSMESIDSTPSCLSKEMDPLSPRTGFGPFFFFFFNSSLLVLVIVRGRKSSANGLFASLVRARRLVLVPLFFVFIFFFPVHSDLLIFLISPFLCLIYQMINNINPLLHSTANYININSYFIIPLTMTTVQTILMPIA